MDRRKPADVLRYALNCAVSDRQHFIEAYGPDMQDDPAVKDAWADIRAFALLKQRIFGKEENEDPLESAKTVTLAELRNLREETTGATTW